MRRFIIEVLWCIAIALVVTLQVSFIHTLNVGAYIELPLLLSMACVILRFETRGLVVAAVSAYLMDIHSVLPFGVHIVAYLFSMSTLLFFQRSVFKNAALHAVGLNTLIATCVYHVLTIVFILLLLSVESIRLSEWSLTQAMTYALIHTPLHVLVILAIMQFSLFFSNRFIHPTQYYVKRPV